MKLLVITQAVDLDNPGLGFFHQWLIELASRVSSITVICLEKGKYTLPDNVKVLSLGKEVKRSRSAYIKKFYSYIWRERKNYDVVFVHMNQEYVLLGGFIWKILGKRILLWRNHPLGNFLTDGAVWLSNKVYCTSPFAYTAKFKKTKLMPVGITTDHFKNSHVTREKKLLMFGRIDPIKKPEIVIDALHIMYQEQEKIPAVFVGDFLNSQYEKTIKHKIQDYRLSDSIEFKKSVSQTDAPSVLSSYEIYVNATPTGSMDKAIFEAMACETLILTSNKALIQELPSEYIFEENNAVDLADRAVQLDLLSEEEKKIRGQHLREYVIENHSLTRLFDKLVQEFKAHD